MSGKLYWLNDNTIVTLQTDCFVTIKLAMSLTWGSGEMKNAVINVNDFLSKLY
jgi:hypothetical protein